ncbi:MAG: MFS transporter [Anaerolinea sp.]|nr:MFS transporter [Anaerolinea sp.]
MTTQPSAESRSRNVEFWVILAAILASAMAFIDSSALDVTAPALQADLGIDATQLLWIINSYMLTLSALMLAGGALGDIFGRKRMFAIGIGLSLFASILCGLAQDPNFLIAARALQGVGGAIMTPGSLAIISATVAQERRGRAIGTWATFATLTTLLGPVLGGWLASLGLWRMIFFINVPVAAIALFALLRYVPESYGDRTRRVDIPGAVLVTVGLAALAFGFLQASDVGWGDPVVLAAIAAGVIALALFLLVERRSDHPMVPFSLFKSRTFSGTNLLTFFLYAALRFAPFFLVLNLQQAQGYPPEVAGFAFLPFSVLLTLMSRWSGAWSDRIGARLPLIIGPAITGIGFAMLALPGLTGGQNDYWTSYFPGVIALGIGMGITVTPLTTAVISAAPEESSGTASGINNAVARTAGALGLALVGSLAILYFTGVLQPRLTGANIPAGSVDVMMANAGDFGALSVPAELTGDMASAANEAIRWAFVDTFRLVMIAAAVLAWISAGMAALLVEDKKSN